MADKRDSRSRFVVRHSNLLSPEDYYRFIHLDGFTSDWKDLGLSDDDLAILQIQLMLAPQQGRVVPGAGGVRKMRFAPPSWKRGKRGALRVLYAVFPDYFVAVLAAAYSKNEQEDVTAEDRKALKMILKDIEHSLMQGD